MRYFAAAVLSLCLLSCTNDSSKPPIDAAGSGHMDAPAHMDATVHMDAAANVCTGMVYDACNPAASNCMGTTTCKTFSGSMFSVCTPTCDAQNPCPMQNGQPVTCNNMGICKPNAPNTTCTAPM